VREPSEGKIGRAVLTIALIAATAMLVLVLVSFVGLIVQRGFQGAPMHDRQAFHGCARSGGCGAVCERGQPQNRGERDNRCDQLSRAMRGGRV
jgi:hypothetical protein